MADPPQRPRFRDGQPLAAADLELLEEHARNHDARHDRALHTPGIALGLNVTEEVLPMNFNGQTINTRQLTVRAGIADDGNGVQVVLAADRLLQPTQFLDDIGRGDIDQQLSIPGVTHLYPLLLVADDRDGPAPAFSQDGCGPAGGPTRVVEDVQLRIGRRGEEIGLAAQRTLGPGDDLSDAGPFRLLLGFVRFHPGLGRYVDLEQELNGIRPRRAGVRAAEVVTAGERLLLRLGDPPAPGQPSLALEAANGGQLRFGRSTADGGIDPVIEVTLAGVVTFHGIFKPERIVGMSRVQSGVATDGMPLPLPPGVTPKAMQDGEWEVHVQVTPRFPAVAPPPAPPSAFLVARCDVDANRVVHCEFWRLESGSSVLTAAPGSCNFLVIAAVVEPPPQGASP
jgi:hypothetical protein